MTYGEIAALVAQKRGVRRMSAQAVGGLDLKRRLLSLEGIAV